MRARALWFSIPVMTAAILMAVFSLGQSVPQLINYQGRLTNPAGQPIDGASVDLTFSFYGAQTGNTAFLSVLQENVLITHGVYNVLIGSGTITPGTESSLADVFQKHQEVWLGVRVDADPEMTPRARIATVPYAMSIDPSSIAKIMSDYLRNPDWDGDGLTKTGNPADCDDWNPSIQYCCADFDRDGFFNQAGCGTAVDCNDTNIHVYPGAIELCDGIDNQCPGDPGYGQVDEGCGPPPGVALIPAGCFDMGDAFSEGNPNELPVHHVCITSDFYMDAHEVTNAEYKACDDDGWCAPPEYSNSYSHGLYYGNTAYNNFPVIYVSWYQARDYCTWAGKRLPTEAEWEYAARGGLSGKRYPWGDSIGVGMANYQDSGDPWDNDTSRVGYFPANGYGLYDMAGNVAEWVNDWYQEDYYSISPSNDPPGPATGMGRLSRGGAFWGIPPYDLRVSDRSYYPPPDVQWESLGFRCAKTLSVADTTPPTAPTNLIVTAVSLSRINLTWTASTDNVGVTGYMVYRPSSLVGSPATTNFSNTGLAANTQYCYTVRAVDAAGNLSEASGQQCATTFAPDTTPPTAPTNLSATAVSSSQINLTWTPSTDNVGVAGYRVYRPSLLVGSTSVNNYNDTGLAANTQYCYTVKAIDAAGNLSGPSSPQCATTFAPDITPPTAPTNLSATPVGFSQINLTWTVSTDDVGVTGYRVYRPSSLVGSPTATYYSDTGLAENTQYCYTVKAIDAAGNLSDASGQQCSTTGSAPDSALIPAGCFDMGDAFSEGNPNELPVHQVCITSDFYMDVHEVTNAEYKACDDDGWCAPPEYSSSDTHGLYYGSTTYNNFPVIYVSWNQAVDYCTWAGKRLPTEAEWEYAARGGLSGKRYPWGNSIGVAKANYGYSGDPWDNDTTPVGYFPANGYGLYDMTGNVMEWVNDWYQEDYYSYSLSNDPPGPATGTSRVLRGGSFSDIPPYNLRVSNRSYYGPPDMQYSGLGFRCAGD